MRCELFFVFAPRALADERCLRRVMALIADAPLGPWTRYDLDGMGNWRAFDLERASIDALTQRTAYLRIEGAGEALALLALGKRGEPPTALLRGEAPSPEAARDLLLEVARDAGLPLRRAGVSPVEARAAFFAEARGMSQVAGVDVACWLYVTAAPAELPRPRLEALGVDVEPLPASRALLRLLDDPTRPPAELVARWKSLAEGLAQRVAAP